MPILTAPLNKRMRIIQWLYILSLEMMVPACSFKHLRETSHSSKKKGKWTTNSWREIKYLWNPSDKKRGQNCMQEEKGHAEHCTASSVGCYFDIPIWWKFILQKNHTNTDFTCFDLWIRVAGGCSTSHIWISVSLNFMTLIPVFVLTNQHSCKKSMFLKNQSTFNFLSFFTRDWYPCL